jgi:hypothetical protein
MSHHRLHKLSHQYYQELIFRFSINCYRPLKNWHVILDKNKEINIYNAG